jgi:hypothetical protein
MLRVQNDGELAKITGSHYIHKPRVNGQWEQVNINHVTQQGRLDIVYKTKK